ncbi:hypothetical protein [Treponema pedis]|uniref:hypothetical protein n=1 Tax=Treponema pedis TaxID=409322 RepID=UPI003D1A67AE
MKQRRTVSILGMLILAVSAVVLTVSCGKVPSKYIGSYSGTWSFSGYTGNWKGEVDKDGKFNIKITTSTSSTDIILTVLKDGVFSGSATIEKDKLIFKGSINDKKVTGTISKDGMPVGIIIGKKN